MGRFDEGTLINLREALGMDDATVEQSLVQSAVREAVRLVLVIYSPAGIREIELTGLDTLTVGRSSTADVQVEDPSISRLHAKLRVQLEAQSIYLQDLGSKNGTFANEMPVEEPVPVSAGDHIRFGHVWAQLHAVPQVHPAPHATLKPEQFDYLMRDEAERALLLQRSLALVVVESEQRSDRVEAELATILRHSDISCLRSNHRVDILIREASREEVRAQADRIFRRLEAVSMRARLGYAVLPDDAASSRALVTTALLASRGLKQPGVAAARRAARIIRAGRQSLVVGDARMHQILCLLERVAGMRSNVLLVGEPGTGKEMLAEALHSWSLRSGGPFVKLDCAAMADHALELELFGYERGVVPDTQSGRPGHLEQAAGGTLFIDEVGSMGPAVQERLFAALESGKARRVGGDVDIPVDVRVVATAQRDPLPRMERGELNRPLFELIGAVTVAVPPLRSRRPEIPALAQAFANEATTAAQRDAISVGSDSVQAMQGYNWPGNVRELRTVVQQAVARCDGEKLRRQHLPPHVAAADGFIESGINTVHGTDHGSPLSAASRNDID